MRLSSAFFAATVLASAASVALAADRVRTSQRTSSGKVIEMSAMEVTIEKSAARTRIPVNEIISITASTGRNASGAASTQNIFTKPIPLIMKPSTTTVQNTTIASTPVSAICEVTAKE